MYVDVKFLKNIAISKPQNAIPQPKLLLGRRVNVVSVAAGQPERRGVVERPAVVPAASTVC